MVALPYVAKRGKREEKQKKKQRVIYGDGRMRTAAVLRGRLPNCRLDRCSSSGGPALLIRAWLLTGAAVCFFPAKQSKIQRQGHKTNLSRGNEEKG